MTGWERLADLEGGTVAWLATATAVDGAQHLFAATTVGVFMSTDTGRSWRPLGGARRVAGVEIVAASPAYAQDGTVFAGAVSGLYRFQREQTGWEHLLSGSRVLSVAVAPGEGGRLTVLAGTEADGILLSRDGGQSWNGANAGLLDLEILALAVSPDFEDDGLAYAGTPSALYRTRNGAESWREIELPSEGTDDVGVQCLALSAGFADDRVMLAGTLDRRLLRSDDRGRSWEEVADLADCDVYSLTPLAGGRCIAATDRGVALSDDGGVCWRLVGVDLEGVVSATLVEDGPARVLLAGVADTGIFRSEDDGKTWTAANAGLNAAPFVGLLLSPDFERDHTIYAYGLQTFFGVSEDGGRTWTTRTDDLESEIAVAALPDGTLALSSEAEAGWADLQSPDAGAQIVAVSFSFDPDVRPRGDIYAATVGRAGGADPGVTVWRTSDRGRRWDRWLALPDVPAGSAVSVLALPPNRWSDPALVGAGGQVYRARINVWEIKGGVRRPVWDTCQLPGQAAAGRQPAITGLVASPEYAQDRTIFAATSAGIYVSRDGGFTFTAWADGSAPAAAVAVKVSPAYARDRLVFALGLGGTIWRREDR